jgi:hypothetical protein
MSLRSLTQCYPVTPARNGRNDVPPSSFKSAAGTASGLILGLAFIAYLLLPFAHPVYVVVVVPCIIIGLVVASWRVWRRPAAMPSLSRSQKETPEPGP